jgi:hypothetical protein
LCYNCHMPYTTYGLLKTIRSHQIDNPSVQNTLDTGRPNACNLCHLDKSLAWTADSLTAWFGQPRVELSDDQQTIAASVLWLLRGDAGQRAIVGQSLGWDAAQAASGTDWMAPYLAMLLEDPYDAVRFIAYRSLRSLPGFSGFDFDFICTPPERTAARQRALGIWRNRNESKLAVPRPQVLLDPAGTLQLPEVERLLQQRDTRAVNLGE